MTHSSTKTAPRWPLPSTFLLVAAALPALLGCGGNGLPMTPVSGRVTFDGGPPPSAGRVTFTPSEVYGDLPRRPGLARFGTDGKFVVTSFHEGDGLAPGKYTVKVSCLSGLPDVAKRDASATVSLVPADYRPEELVVEMDSAPIEVTYDVPRQKRH